MTGLDRADEAAAGSQGAQVARWSAEMRRRAPSEPPAGAGGALSSARPGGSTLHERSWCLVLAASGFALVFSMRSLVCAATSADLAAGSCGRRCVLGGGATPCGRRPRSVCASFAPLRAGGAGAARGRALALVSLSFAIHASASHGAVSASATRMHGRAQLGCGRPLQTPVVLVCGGGIRLPPLHHVLRISSRSLCSTGSAGAMPDVGEPLPLAGAPARPLPAAPAAPLPLPGGPLPAPLPAAPLREQRACLSARGGVQVGAGWDLRLLCRSPAVMCGRGEGCRCRRGRWRWRAHLIFAAPVPFATGAGSCAATRAHAHSVRMVASLAMTAAERPRAAGRRPAGADVRASCGGP